MSEPGLVLERYALLRLLVRGGMGSVYLARVEGAEGFRKPVAVKLIHRHLMDDPGAVEAFVREAKLVVRLAHPNIVQVVDFGQHRNQYLAVLEYVHGHDLSTLTRYLSLTKRRLAIEHSAFLVYQVLRGLDFAHRLKDDDGAPLGLVHRDISPQNILISTDGHVSLTDFGIARVQSEVTRTSPGDLKGKLAYMSPEQVSGKRVDHRSDLFSLGIVLHELLSGERLFHSDSEPQTIMRVHQAEIPDIRESRPELSERASSILARSLARDPEDRYQSAGDFASDVRELLGGSTPDEVEPSFRSWIEDVYGQTGFLAVSEPLPNLAKALEGDPLVLEGEAPAPEELRPSVTMAKPATTGAAPNPLRLLFVMGVAAALVAALGAAVVLWGLGDTTGHDEPLEPVAVIIDRHHRDPVLDATVLPAPTSDGAEPAEATNENDAGTTTADSSARPDSETPEHAPVIPAASPPRPRRLDGKRVSSTLLRRHGALRRCFELAGEGNLVAERVTIRLEVAGDGTVGWANVEPASVQSSPTGRCLSDVARSTRFPPHSGDALVFRVPIAVRQN